MAKQLRTEQLIAIKYLALPNRGGKTYEEIAKECGVTVQTLGNWRRSDIAFQTELKRQSNRIVIDMLPDLHDAAIKGFFSDPTNAALYDKLMRVAGNMTDKVEVDANVSATPVTVEQAQARIAEWKAKQQGAS
jgi:predicted transcriptional regulator